MKIRTCGACGRPNDTTTVGKLRDIDGNPVKVVYCKPCIDKVQKQFETLVTKPEVETDGAWSTATWDSD